MREGERGEHETRGYKHFALHAPKQWALQGEVVKSGLRALFPPRPQSVGYIGRIEQDQGSANVIDCVAPTSSVLGMVQVVCEYVSVGVCECVSADGPGVPGPSFSPSECVCVR